MKEKTFLVSFNVHHIFKLSSANYLTVYFIIQLKFLADHTYISSKCGFKFFQTQISTHSVGKLFQIAIRLRRGWWGRRLCVGWTQRFQNDLLFRINWLLFNTRNLLAGSGIDFGVSTWGHYIAFSKGHMVCLLWIVIYVYRADSQFV